MANFAVTNASSGQAVSSTFKTLIATYASSVTQALRRGKIFDVLVGTNGTPGDQYMTWDISRITTSGTATAGALNPLDSADASAAAVAAINYTAEGTITSSSSVFSVGVNQRASYRWVAAPGSELVYPATAINGLALRTLSGGYTGTATGQLYLMEQ